MFLRNISTIILKNASCHLPKDDNVERLAVSLVSQVSQLLSVSPKGIPSIVTNVNKEHAVAHLVGELRYKPEGREFDS